MRTLPLLALLGLSLIGCASTSTTSETVPSPADRGPTTAVRIISMRPREQLWSVVDSLHLRRPALIARYGQPASAEHKSVPGWVDPATTDSLVTLRYPLFEAMYHVRPDRSTSMMHVTIAQPAASIPPDARPGVSRANLVKFLGEPDYQSDEEEGILLLYKMKPASDDDGNVLNILLVDGTVRWVSWVFFPEVWWMP